MDKKILELKNLKMYFPVDKKRVVRAVDDVSLTVNEGEVLGLVGESGSGKSTIAYTIMGMYKQTDGEIIFDDEIITKNDRSRSKEFRRKAQIVFQDPGSSLNYYQDIRTILSLPLKVHNIVPRNEMDKKILEILHDVELPENFMFKTPSGIGGGEKQLVAIARALCCNPKFIILDEPTSSLDVSIQAKILHMLMKLKEENNLTYIFITHDLSVIRNVSDRVAIMYLGQIVEVANTEEFYSNPCHPYTQMLLSAIPVISEEEDNLKPTKIKSEGEIPSPVNIPSGCRFNTRCRRRFDICREVEPEMVEISPGHLVKCHLFTNGLN